MFKKHSLHLSFWEGTSKIVHKHIRLITLGTSLVGLAALYALYKATKTPTGQTPNLPNLPNLLIDQTPINPVVKEGDLAPTAGTIEKYVSVITQLIRNVQGPSAICLDVYITCRTTGLIRKDGEFKFGERIKDVEGNPLVIDPVKDFYVQLGFQPTSSSGVSQGVISKNAKGIPGDFYLPSNLFAEKKEGDIVSFYYDGQLMKLHLCQKGFVKSSSLNFEGVLGEMRICNLFNKMQAFFNVDIDRRLFCGIEVGDTLTGFTVADPTNVVNLENLEMYIMDQQLALYRELSVEVGYSENKIVYTFHDLRFEGIIPEDLEDSAYLFQGVKPSDVHVIRSQGMNGLDDLWILILHQLHKNRFGGTLTSALGSDGEYFTRTVYRNRGHAFHPEQGDRLAFYQFGRYKRIPIPQGYAFSLNFLKNTQPYFHRNDIRDMRKEEVLQVVFSKIAL